MASEYSKIKRSTSNFINFLEYYESDYLGAAEDIIPEKGWRIQSYEDEVYELVKNMYNLLYSDLYPKLTPGHPATDTEILNHFIFDLRFFRNSYSLFDRILKKSNEKTLSLAESIIQGLISLAINKLDEVISLAAEDIENPEVKSHVIDLNNPIQGRVIGIVTATNEEHDAVLNLMKDIKRSKFDKMDSGIYHEGYFVKDDKRQKIILTKSHHQGLPAATSATTRIIYKYDPAAIFMVGHLAGNMNMKNKLLLGDICIAEESVDYQQNEIIQRQIDQNRIEEKDRKRPIGINSWLKSELESFSKNTFILEEIRLRYPDHNYFPSILGAHVGKVVSGSALLRAKDRFDEIIKDNPGLIGLDMETHGVYYAAKNTLANDEVLFASIKSISDYGEQKSNFSPAVTPAIVRQKYACHTSANFLYEFIMQVLV